MESDDCEMSMSQSSYIYRLLEERRITRKTANTVIELLLEHPPISASGLETIHEIQRPK